MNVVWFLHNLQPNGSNNTALAYCEMLVQCGFAITVSSRDNGLLHKSFIRAGAHVELGEASDISIKHPDIVIVNSLIRHDAMLFSKQRGLPYIVCLHENWQAHDFNGQIHPLMRWALPNWESMKVLLSSAARLIFPAKFLRAAYEAFTNCEVIYNPLPPSRLQCIDYNSEDREGKINLINIGSINENKNQKLAVLAADESNVVSNVSLYGERHIRSHESEYIQELKQLGCTCTNFSLSFFPAEFPLKLTVSDRSVLIITSQCEVLPCTIQEMMLLGVPVLAPNRFGIPEIIHSEKSGILFDDYSVEDVVAGLHKLADPEIRDTVRTNAKASALNLFEPRRAARQLIDCIAVAVEQHR